MTVPTSRRERPRVHVRRLGRGWPPARSGAGATKHPAGRGRCTQTRERRGRPPRSAPVAQRPGRYATRDLAGAARRRRPVPPQLRRVQLVDPGVRPATDRRGAVGHRRRTAGPAVRPPGTEHTITAENVRGAPDLVIEILSPSTADKDLGCVARALQHTRSARALGAGPDGRDRRRPSATGRRARAHRHLRSPGHRAHPAAQGPGAPARRCFPGLSQSTCQATLKTDPYVQLGHTDQFPCA